jgi:MazG family protein
MSVTTETPPLSRKPIPAHADGLARLQAIVHDLRSPGGCPWDQEQTPQSLIPNVIEEAYETVEALQGDDPSLVCEELGDLLLQVVIQSEIASETHTFDLQQVAHGISEKLIRRHPHVYGSSEVSDTAGVLAQWDEIKAKEKGGAPKPLLHNVGKGMPALTAAAKLQKKAAKVGFDWPDTTGVIAKIHEELAELAAETDPVRRAEELGDVLFSLVNLARKEGHDPEALALAANTKFSRRFGVMETALRQAGRPVGQATMDEMEAAWQAAKRGE